MMILLWLVPLIFALLYRFRGGPLSFKYWLSEPDINGEYHGGTQAARLIWWTLPNTIAFYFLSGSIVGSLIFGLFVFLGLLIPHAEYQDSSSEYDIAGMAKVLFARAFLCAWPLVILVSFKFLLFPFIAALGALGYYAGHEWLKEKFKITTAIFNWIPYFPQQWKNDSLASSPSEWGEVFVGLAWGLAFIICIML